ncbi:PTS sugar transporter subunit IIA [Bacillus rugosus]|uniref:PTS sugar transporter subunit IIA n=1 Tax=Bacillus rugosus TaxID=2715209 RepID=UPI002DBBB51E|nr:PTS sugar transporter subunit IIA [Bacillus rugosus]MEC1548495.1 PTS sugar transporter subunit IIA [Bacillus rugosus]
MKNLLRMYSAIVYQNMILVITAGLVNTLFGERGWLPNPRFSPVIDSLYLLVIPLIFAYTGGRMTAGQRGGITASAGVLGLTLSSDLSMILPALLLGPLFGWLYKQCERFTQHRFPIGMELLFSHVTGALLSTVFLLFCLYVAGPAGNSVITHFYHAVLIVAKSVWLPAAACFIEPGKVLFLNNVMNHGILGPIGIQQTKELGKSIFFLLEANPGPGLGVLAARFFCLQKEERLVLKTAIGIHAIGGIHEVYFPYILKCPLLFLPLIAGSAAGIAVFSFFDTGLVSTASPASALLILSLTPKGDTLFVAAGMLISCTVSLVLAYPIFSAFDFKAETGLPAHLEPVSALHPQKLIVTCDGGLASSAMGAAILKKLTQQNWPELQISYAAIHQIPQDTDVIIGQQHLKPEAKKYNPNIPYIGLISLADESEYDKVLSYLAPSRGEPVILLNQTSETKTEAITLLSKYMQESGLMKQAGEFLIKDPVLSNGAAVFRCSGKEAGLVILQFPHGVYFKGTPVYLLIGLSGGAPQQLRAEAEIAVLLSDESMISELRRTDNKQFFMEVFHTVH